MRGDCFNQECIRASELVLLLYILALTLAAPVAASWLRKWSSFHVFFVCLVVWYFGLNVACAVLKVVFGEMIEFG